MNTTAVFEEARKEQEMSVPVPTPAPTPPKPSSAQASPFAQKELIKRECITIINKYKKMQGHGY